MSSQSTNRKLKGYELSMAVSNRLEDEPHGNGRLIVENLLRGYYGLPPMEIDQIEDSRFNR